MIWRSRDYHAGIPPIRRVSGRHQPQGCDRHHGERRQLRPDDVGLARRRAVGGIKRKPPRVRRIRRIVAPNDRADEVAAAIVEMDVRRKVPATKGDSENGVPVRANRNSAFGPESLRIWRLALATRFASAHQSSASLPGG
jgi:hypothetical protein